MGRTWEEASPDLSKNEKERQIKGGGPYTVEAVGAENYGTIAYVIESPHEKGILWVGTDDGLVQLTRDNGKTWQNVTPKGLPDCIVNAIDVSPHDPATAYIATTRYKFNDKTPAIYKTNNYGRSWTNISEGIPNEAFTRVIREDENRKGLLYAGTETGIYVSWNDGKSWKSLQLNLPVTPITDILQKHDDLIVATAGRGFWILDDVELLRQHQNNEKETVLYKAGDAVYGSWRSPLNRNSESFNGSSTFVGVNPANGVVFYYRLPKLADSVEIQLEIRDLEGNTVRILSSKEDTDFQSYAGGPSREPQLSKSKGLNRFVWDMCYPSVSGVPKVYIEGSYRGHKAAPGKFEATLVLGENKYKSGFSILKNTSFEIADSDYIEYHQFMSQVEANLDEMHIKVNKILDARLQLESVIKDMDNTVDIKKEAQALVEKMKSWDEEMVQRKAKAYDDVENFPNMFTAEYIYMINQTNSAIPRVNQPNKDRRNELDAQWESLNATAIEILESDLSAMNKKLWEQGIGAVRIR
jgi:hypothetical protein